MVMVAGVIVVTVVRVIVVRVMLLMIRTDEKVSMLLMCRW